MTLLARPIDDSKIMLQFDNVALAERGASADGPAATEKLSASRLVDGNPSTLWRSPTINDRTGEIDLIISLGRTRRVDWISLGHHSNSRFPWAADFHLGDPNATPVRAETDWHEPIIRPAIDEVPWGPEIWNLAPDSEMLDELAAKSKLHSFIQLTQPVNCSHIRLRFDVSSAAVDHIKASEFRVGELWQPDINIINGWSFEANDRTEFQTSERGSDFAVRRPIPTDLAFALSWLRRGAKDETRELFDRWFKRYGKAGIVWCWLEPSNLSSFYTHAGLYRLEQIPALAMDHIALGSAKGFQLCEVL